MEKVIQIIGIAVAIGMLITGCGNQMDSVKADDKAESEVAIESETISEDSTQNISEQADKEPEVTLVSVGGPYGEISAVIPENWSAEAAPVDSEKMMYGLCGLIISPLDSKGGQVELFCSDSFGVCGTGLLQEETTIAGRPAHVGTYDNHEHWDYIVFGEGKPQIVAQHTDCSLWTDGMWEEVISILDTMKFDTTKAEGGICQYIPESEDDTIAVIMNVKNVSASGLTVHLRQYDKRDTGELTYGQSYSLQVLNGDEWEDVPMITDNAAFTDEGYILSPEGEAEMKTDWKWLYGKLSPGTYRIKKSVVDVRPVGNNPMYFLMAQFIIA